MKASKLKKVLIMALAFLMVLGGAFTNVPTSYADMMEVVTYTHANGTKRVTESDENTYVVYCMQASRSPSSTVGTDANKREKYFWNATLEGGGSQYANALVAALYQNKEDTSPKNKQFIEDDWNNYFDGNPDQNPINADRASDGSLAYGLKHLLLATLYYGYPYNNGANTYSEADTQKAIYWCIYDGKDGGDTSSSYYNNLVRDVLENLNNGAFDTIFPEWWNLSMYVYFPTQAARSDGQTQQALIRATYAISPYVSNTTVNANGQTPTDANEEEGIEEQPAKIEINEGEKVTIKDTVTLNGLTAGTKYIVSWEIVKTDGSAVTGGTGTKTIDSASGSSETIEIEMGELENLEGDYTIKTTLKDADGNELSSHNSGLDITKETFKVTVKKPDDDGGDDTNPTVKTKVSKNEIEAAANQKFTDTVTLTGLKEGVEYTITGQLMDKDVQTEVTATCEPITFTATAEDAAAETVTKEMEFTVDATSLGGKSLVVFETLTWKVDGQEKSEKHDKYDDTDQTLSVKLPNTGTETTEVKVTKTWDDWNDLQKKRPESVTIKLLADGTATGATLTLNEANSWTGSFTDLDKAKDGKDIVYTVEEELIDYYVTTISGSAADGFTVNNMSRPWIPRLPNTPGTYTHGGLTVKKVLGEGAPANANGFKFEIKFTYANGDVVTQEITLKDGEVYNFDNVPSDAKVEIKELTEGYKVSYEGAGASCVIKAGEVLSTVVKNDKIPPTNTSPNTGDENNMMLWIAIVLIAGLAAVVTLRVRSSRK